jgi:hypothetical protein
MKHHNKFNVENTSTPNVYKVGFTPLGGFHPYWGVPSMPGNDEVVTEVEINATALHLALNAAYDEGYEKGRQAVRVCMNEAMGFDGE